MKPFKKYLQWVGIGAWVITLGIAASFYHTYQQRQPFLQSQTGVRTKALLGMKSLNWYETKKWFWEVSYWTPGPHDKQPSKPGRLTSARIAIDEADYDRNYEDDRVWVYYLKKKPKVARLEFQLKHPINYEIVWWWGSIGLLALFVARVIL